MIRQFVLYAFDSRRVLLSNLWHAPAFPEVLVVGEIARRIKKNGRKILKRRAVCLTRKQVSFFGFSFRRLAVLQVTPNRKLTMTTISVLTVRPETFVEKQKQSLFTKFFAQLKTLLEVNQVVYAFSNEPLTIESYKKIHDEVFDEHITHESYKYV